MQEFSTIGYKARSARDVARILDRHRVTGAERVAALRSFHNHDHAIVRIPVGRVVINRKGAR
jgi:hypothetical protein